MVRAFRQDPWRTLCVPGVYKPVREKNRQSLLTQPDMAGRELVPTRPARRPVHNFLDAMQNLNPIRAER